MTVTLTCPSGHTFETRTQAGNRAGCPQCRAGGREVRVRVPREPLPPPPPDWSPDPSWTPAQYRRARRRAGRRVQHEAELPLTDTQRELIARARQDLKELSQAEAWAAKTRNYAERDALLAKRNEVSSLLARLLADAEEAAGIKTEWLMRSKPRGRPA